MTGQEDNRPNELVEHAPVTLRRYREDDLDALFDAVTESIDWVHRAYTRRGLATAASAALVEQAFRLPGVERAEIVHDELNIASAGVPRKPGFTKVESRPLDFRPPAGSGTGVVWCLTR